MTPAEQRLADLIARWLASVDLHLKYVALDDGKYAQIQTWPKHARPSKWVLEVAKQKILELKALCDARRGDDKFAEALENMAFLANLVGLQHIERFIPLAVESTTSTVEAPIVKAPPVAGKAARTDEPTREMPRLKVAPPKQTPAAPPKPAPAAVPKQTAAPKAVKTDGKKPHGASSGKGAPAPVALTAALQEKIVADAVRLLKWGKQWHELADTIARIAERPPAAEIRKVLRTHKAEIEGKGGRSR